MVWGAVPVVLGLMCIPATTEASQPFSFSLTPINLRNLPHAFYYTWGINVNLPATERITGAALAFCDFYDLQKEKEDALYANLLDNPASSLVARKEYQDDGDNFVGQGMGVNKVMKKCKGVQK